MEPSPWSFPGSPWVYREGVQDHGHRGESTKGRFILGSELLDESKEGVAGAVIEGLGKDAFALGGREGDGGGFEFSFVECTTESWWS